MLSNHHLSDDDDDDDLDSDDDRDFTKKYKPSAKIAGSSKTKEVCSKYDGSDDDKSDHLDASSIEKKYINNH